MIERFATVARRLNEHAQVLAHAFLPTVVVERLGTQRAVHIEVVGSELTGHRAFAHGMRGDARTSPAGSGIVEEVVLVGLPHHAPPPRRLSA